MSENENQALEKAAGKTPAVIQTPEEYRGALLRWQRQNFTVLTPFVNISGLAPAHGIISTLIQVSTDKNLGEIYDGTGGLPFLKGEEVALAKNGLRKIAEGLGISTRLEYISVGVVPNYWHVKAIATYKGLDGATVTREASVEWDLKDGSVRAREFGDRQIGQARKHGLRNCETRAINAAIRECGCGIKQKYTRQELARPFLAIRVAFQPDMSDPETKRLITERALAGTHALYPAAAAAAVPPSDAFHEDEAPSQLKHVGSGSTVPPAQDSKVTSPPAVDEPPSADAVKIAKVEFKDGETRGHKWRKYLIVDSRGVEYSTFDKQHFDDANKFKAEDAWVEIATEGGQYNNIIEIIRAGSEPTLPGLDSL